MGSKPRKIPLATLLDELAAEMRMYVAGLEVSDLTEWNPFAKKVNRGKKEATNYWLGRIAALRIGERRKCDQSR